MAIYELAYNLQMPVYKLADEMPYDEFLKWFAFFENRPVGWREDDRTFKLLQAQGVKAKACEVFASLAAIQGRQTGGNSDGVDLSNFKKSFAFRMVAGARGGDIIPLEE